MKLIGAPHDLCGKEQKERVLIPPRVARPAGRPRHLTVGEMGEPIDAGR